MNKDMQFIRRFASGVKINKIIRFLTYSDILILSGWGLVNPILAVFFTEQIIGGSVLVAGFASACYFLTKSIFQIPIARYIDLKKGEWDDFWVMITGSLLISFTAFLFIFAHFPRQVYIIQFINALGGALAYPPWLAIFTRHIDKHEEALEWSLYSTSTDLVSAITAGLGGILASRFGYRNLFLIVGLVSLFGTAFLARVARDFKRTAS